MEWTISNIFNLIVAVGALVAGLGYAYGQFFSGRNKQEVEDDQKGINTLGYLRGQIEGLQNLVKQLQDEATTRTKQYTEEMKNFHGQIESLKGQISEKDKLIEHYTKIFQGRDPQLTEILGKVAGSLQNIEHFMLEMKNNVSMRQSHKKEQV